MSAERLAAVVRCNAFGPGAAGGADAVAAHARGEPRTPVLALFAPAALMNHSCSPNATAYVIAGRLVVRAGRPIKRGEEVAAPALGAALLAPAGLRRRLLEAGAAGGVGGGFACACDRCRMEDSLPDVAPGVAAAAAELNDYALTRAGPLLESAYTLLLTLRDEEEGGDGDEWMARHATPLAALARAVMQAAGELLLRCVRCRAVL
jgi:hypothetical protein